MSRAEMIRIFGTCRTQCERDMQPAPSQRRAQTIEPRLGRAVRRVLNHQQGLTKEHLLGFGIQDAMPGVLPLVACVPVEVR